MAPKGRAKSAQTTPAKRQRIEAAPKLSESPYPSYHLRSNQPVPVKPGTPPSAIRLETFQQTPPAVPSVKRPETQQQQDSFHQTPPAAPSVKRPETPQLLPLDLTSPCKRVHTAQQALAPTRAEQPPPGLSSPGKLPATPQQAPSAILDEQRPASVVSLGESVETSQPALPAALAEDPVQPPPSFPLPGKLPEVSLLAPPAAPAEASLAAPAEAPSGVSSPGRLRKVSQQAPPGTLADDAQQPSSGLSSPGKLRETSSKDPPATPAEDPQQQRSGLSPPGKLRDTSRRQLSSETPVSTLAEEPLSGLTPPGKPTETSQQAPLAMAAEAPQQLPSRPALPDESPESSECALPAALAESVAGPTSLGAPPQSSQQTPSAAPAQPPPSRFQQLAEVTLALKDTRYFSDVPAKVRELVATVVSDCLTLEYGDRHALQHQMIGVVDEAFAAAQRHLVSELDKRQAFVAASEPKKQAFFHEVEAKQAVLDTKLAEVAKAEEDVKTATERLGAMREAAARAAEATLAERQAMEDCASEGLKAKKAYEEFVALDGAPIERVKATMAALSPILRCLGIDDSAVEALPEILAKPEGERIPLDNATLMITEGTFAKKQRCHAMSVDKCEEAVKLKESEEATLKQEVQRLSDALSSSGENLKSKKDEQKTCEEKVGAASDNLSEHLHAMSTAVSKVESQRTLLQAFEDIQSRYSSLKCRAPCATEEPSV